MVTGRAPGRPWLRRRQARPPVEFGEAGATQTLAASSTRWSYGEQMSDSVLRLAGQIYSPFDPRETRRLRNYVSDVEELVASAFFQPGEQKLTLSAEMGGPLLSTLVYPGEEAVRAVVGLFRQLYNHHEPTSYDQIIKLLSRHAQERGSQHRDVAVAELRALRAWEKDALRPTIALKWQHTRPDGSMAYEEDLTPEVLIDLFLHGKYLHKGNEKSDKLEAWPLAHIAQQSFFGAMTALAQVYWVGRNVVAEVLEVPTLLNAAPAS